MDTENFGGVVTPLLTPYDDDLSIATDLFLNHAATCLSQGSHYLSPFGTTGEAASNTARERMAVLEALVASGTATPAQLMPGTGLCALEETLDLTRHAADLGCAAAMILPPFFYSAAGDDGLFRYFAGLIEALGGGAPKICLYHIPQNTGVPVSPGLAARLNAAFPEIVVAYKDSGGDWDHTRAVIAAAPGLSVFPASESLLAQGIELGAGGCISATCNSNAAGIRALYDAARVGDAARVAALQPGIDAHRNAVAGAGLIGGLKSLMAHRTGNARWLNLRPPHLDADPNLGPALAATIPADL